ncbi:MAG: dihydrolipoyl dehydrogenase [Deferrisomatales bacterium]
MSTVSADVVVIGAGPGGYVCAVRAAQLGLRTLVVEEGPVGGVCLNWGCVPSKALIQAADSFHRLGKELPAMGVSTGQGPSVDAEKLQGWKDALVRKLTSGVRGLLKGNGIELVRATARVVAPDTVEVTAEGDTHTVTARRGIVLATGSTPARIPGLEPDGQRLLTAKEVLSLSRIPGRLAVIGGGVIGLELGTVYRKLGAEVTVVEMMPTLLPGLDPDVVTACGRRLRQLKMKALTGARVEAVRAADDGVRLTVLQGEQSQEVAADAVLVAVGMRPRTEGLGLERLGVELDARGFVRVDERCRTAVPGIYAVGDLTGPPMLAHKASFEGEVAAEALAGHGDRTRTAPIPSAVFTDPEVGTVGLTEPQALEAGYDVKVGKFYFAASAKALVLQEPHGFVKVVADRASDRVLGVHIVGAHASDLLAEATLAVDLGLTVERWSRVVRPHPTLSEITAEALLDADGHAIHAVKK